MSYISVQSLTVVALPLDVGLGLISYQSIEGSFHFREKQFLSQISENCSLAFMTTYKTPTQSPRFIGYCLDLSSHRLCNVYVLIIHLDRLNSSSMSSDEDSYNERGPLECFDIHSNTFLSNILYYPNQPVQHCFFTDFGHIKFLSNSFIIDHSHENVVYEQIGPVNVPACSVNEPRIQRLGRECRLAVYCNETTAVVRFESQVETSFSIETDGQVFICTSSEYVRFRNGTLSMENENRVLGSLPFDAENISLGECHVYERQHYFIAALDDGRLILVNIANQTIITLPDSVTLTVPYSIRDQLLFVNSLSGTQIYNLTSICEDDRRSIPSNFDLVLSFMDRSSTQLCGCTRDVALTTTAAPVDTTELIELTTFSTLAIESTLNPTGGTPTGSSPSSISVLLGGVVGGVIGVLVIFIIIILIVCLFRW